MTDKIFGYEFEDIKRAQQGGSLTRKLTKKPDYRANCRSNKKFLGGEYGWFKDTTGIDRVERINPTALYTYIYRTDKP